MHTIGAGGTQRLPRLCGVKKAVEIMTTGRTLAAKEALQCNILDDLSPAVFNNIDELEEGISSFISKRNVLDIPLSSRRVSRMQIPGGYSDEMFKELYQSVGKAARGFTAPMNILRAVEDCAKLGNEEGAFAKGLQREAELFAELARGPQSKALQYFFFSERKVNTPPKVDESTGGIVRHDIKSVGVIGGGTMGAGITMSFCNAGVPVVLVETSEELAKAAKNRILTTYQSSSLYKSGKQTDEDLNKIMNKINFTNDMQQLSNCDLVIEAVYENINIKKDIFKKLNNICKDNTILASNTSCLDIDDIASVTSRPQNVIGTRKLL
jgi:3-hydroxyacyl-CoA dehydrogenase